MKRPEKITVRGRIDAVIDELTLDKKRFFVLEQLSGAIVFACSIRPPDFTAIIAS